MKTEKQITLNSPLKVIRPKNKKPSLEINLDTSNFKIKKAEAEENFDKELDKLSINKEAKKQAQETLTKNKETSTKNQSKKSINQASSSLEINKVEEEIKNINWGNFNVKELAIRILKLAEIMAMIELRPYQKKFGLRVILSVLLNDGEEITALFSRQSGKTETIAVVTNALMIILPTLAKIFPQLKDFKNGFWVGLFAPQAEQAMTALNRMEARLSTEHTTEVLNDPSVKTKYKPVGAVISFDNGSFCKLQSAAKQAKVESKTYHMVIIDEAQDVDTLKIQKSIHPMVSATNGTIVKLGTPTNHHCEFLDAIDRNKKRDLRAKLKNHFEFDYKVVGKYSPKYKAFIQKEKDRIGEDSDAFRMSYKLEWILEKTYALTISQFDTFLKASNLGFDYGIFKDPDTIYIGGLDLARKQDYTILTVLKVKTIAIPEDDKIKYERIKTIANWLELKGDDWEQQIIKIIDFITPYNLLELRVDSTGVGDPIVSLLKSRLKYESINIIGININIRWTDSIVRHFYNEMRQRRIKIPANPIVRKSKRFKNFIFQWTNAEKIYKGKFLTIHHLEKEGYHDDYVYSFLLALDAERELDELNRETETYSNNFFFHSTKPNRTKRLRRLAKLNPHLKKYL